jgi:hypothetical protein
MKIYYAHFMGIYNTTQEERDVELIKYLYPCDELYNPNNEESQIGYKEQGMNYFYSIIKDCDLLIFRGLPNGKIPAGVYGEIENAMSNNIPIIELPCFTGRKWVFVFPSVHINRSNLNTEIISNLLLKSF